MEGLVISHPPSLSRSNLLRHRSDCRGTKDSLVYSYATGNVLFFSCVIYGAGNDTSCRLSIDSVGNSRINERDLDMSTALTFFPLSETLLESLDSWRWTVSI